MKKLISGMTALTLAGLMSITAFAQAAPENTTIYPTGEVNGEFVIDPDPNTANTTVEFKVNPDYTVTIPATVTLTGTKGNIYTGSGTIEADNVFLKSNQKIVVSLTSASKFNLKTPESTEYTLPYTATGAFGAVNKETGGKVAEFEAAALTATEPQTVAVNFATDSAPAYAGDYTDPVVFTIAVVTES